MIFKVQTYVAFVLVSKILCVQLFMADVTKFW